MDQNRRFGYTPLIVCAFVILGCSDDRRVERSMHPWVSWPEELNVAKWSELEKESVLAVTKSASPELVGKLDKTQMVQINADEFEEYTGTRWPHGEERMAFVVRAIGTEPESGKFKVYIKDDLVWVRHGVLGRTASKEAKVPLVIAVPFRPRLLFVDRTGGI
jgi:hypothetical protein